MGQHAEQVAEVGLGIEAVETGGGNQSEQVARGLRMVVAADEQPGFAPHRNAAELALGGVVVETEATVVVEPRQWTALAMGVAERGAEQAALIADALVFDIDPGKERVGVGGAGGSRVAP